MPSFMKLQKKNWTTKNSIIEASIIAPDVEKQLMDTSLARRSKSEKDAQKSLTLEILLDKETN